MAGPDTPPPDADAAAAAARPDRHYLTLLFVDLCRSTALAGVVEAEQYAALLAALRDAYRTQVRAHGGEVVRMQGDGLLAMFGYPGTAEDDVRRALRAALALHAQVRDLPVALPAGFQPRLHSGVHAGLVLVGAGDTDRGRFELMGAVPNIAARLCDLAGQDEIIVSADALGPAAAYFVCGSPRQARIKGYDEPFGVVDVLAEAAAKAMPDAAGPAQRSGFVGRDAEWLELGRCLVRARDGPDVIAVAGAAGIGKTRLVQRFVQHAVAEGWRVLRGHCDSHAGAEPMQPFAQMLREVAPDAAAAARPQQAGAAAREALAAIAHSAPLLLFIDDWQWADDASHQVLQGLRRTTGCRLAVVLTTRGTAPAAADVTSAIRTLALQPLPDAEALQLVAAHLPQADPFLIAEICRHAGGNPLFIGELCHSVTTARLRDGNFAADVRQPAGAGPRGSVAASLGNLIQSRVHALPARQAALVRTAAVIGNLVPAWLLDHLSGCDADAPDVLALADHDLLYPSDRPGVLRFKHGIARDVIYAGIELHMREQLHLRVAAALQYRNASQPLGDLLEALSYHFEAGGEATLAAHYAEAAGDRALAASALDRARAQYRVALAALGRHALVGARALRWISIVQRLSLVSLYDATRADVALVERALALAEGQSDVGVTARARYWVAYLHYGLGQPAPAVRHGERALAEARQAGDEPLAVQVIAMLGEAHTTAGNYGPALALLDEAIAVKRRHRSGRRTNVGLAFSLVCRASVLGDRGRFAAAHDCFDEAQACVLGDEHEIGATVSGWRAAVLLWQGRWAEAHAAAVRSAAIASGTRSLAQYSIARAMQGYAGLMTGDAPGALRMIEEATAWLAPRETGLFRSLNHGWLTEGQLAAGQRGAARRHAALAWRRARNSDRLGLAMGLRAVALDDAARGDMAAAQRHLAAAHAAARRRESAHDTATTLLAEARLLLATGAAAPARPVLDTATAAFDRLGMAWHLQQARWLARHGRDAVPALLLRPAPLPAADA